MRFYKAKTASYLFLILLVISLPLILGNTQILKKYIIRATGRKAQLVVDTTKTLGPVNPNWRTFSQGGEESLDMFAPVIPQIKELRPLYIRIDHLYDHFNVVQKNELNQLTFDFSQLDKIVTSILSTGAKPYFSLSYMPSVMSWDNNITSAPQNWAEWQEVVQKTIEHYSGKQNLNLSDVYYEVWNEPDLFGEWKTYGEKNYLTLYSYASYAAQSAQNTQNFFLGGPATTKLYENWLTALLKHVSSNNLRLDFISWHSYTTNSNQLDRDYADASIWISKFPDFANLPLIISEWGIDSNNHPANDNQISAAFTVSSVMKAKNFKYLMSFELVDGPSPNNQALWGRWGLITHPKTGILTKPRYQSFILLNQISGEYLLVEGEGSWVNATASKDEKAISILAVNYDIYNSYAEQVPLKIINLENGNYRLEKTRLGQSPVSQEVNVANNEFATTLLMPANSLILIRLTNE